MSQLTIDDFAIPGATEDDFLKICAKRYRPKQQPKKGTRTAALLFTPNVGAHRETWQTSIERLFEIQHRAGTGIDIAISEAWALEYPHHGLAAIVNEDALLNRPQGIADMIIPVGYSASTCVIILTTSGMDLNRLPYPMMILVEPPMMTRQVLAKASRRTGSNSPHAQLELVIATVESKRDTWPTREEARRWMAHRLPWKDWNPRVLEHFAEFALRDLPTATYPTGTGVTLCCTRKQEVTCYTYYQDALDGVDRLTELCPVLPIHCIFGEKNDLIAAETQRALVDPASGRRMASITRIPGAGHLVVQEQPFKVAERILAILNPQEHAKL
ncbi:alpha/beta-hydrolase [Mycena filopes]|nr:alpha/beta-hydrolase [Mycena filopes]